jgi:hypothetical protein
MATSEIDKLLAQIRQLDANQQRALREALSEPVDLNSLSEDEFEVSLAAAGILGSIAPQTACGPWAAIQISGEPLSRTIVQERR